ncbi:N-6 DNA methylase [Mycobacteroides abscessus]|uniref:N-6 DNA methylase n=1 Tax=Mycobacteroides abscessus TaxID=36809 RepID=UPI000C262E2D|nr:N-6 DNA methylase [Mycobacteroides abscessus]
MLDYINDTVLPKLVNKYNHSGDVFSPWLGISDPEILKKIVDELDSLTLLDVDSDIKGDAFEYFLKNSVSVGNDLGEYYTPRHIVKLMVELADPKFGDTVYDPCCGTGGFLIEAFRHIKLACSQTPENIKILEKKTIYGNELTGTAKLAKMNMILAGDGHANIKQQDSLEHPAKKKHNIVLSNFPFNQRTQFSNYYGMSSQDGNPVFLAHIMQALAENGRAAVVVPDSSLYSTNIAAVSVRKRLLTQFSVIAVIQLDPFVFAPYTRQPTSIVVFENKKSDDPVYFFEVINDGYAKGARRIPVKLDDLPLLRQSWTSKEESNQSFNVSRDVIAANNYVLFMNAYKPRAATGNSVKLGELVDEIVIGETPPRSQHDHFLGSIPWAKIADLGSDKLADTSEKLTEDAVASINASKKIPPGALLMSFKLSIGKTAITATSIYTNEAVCWLKLKNIYNDPETIRYLYHMLPTLDYSPYAVRSAKGLTLNSTSILNVEIPFPDKKRRGQAVKALDRIAKKIQKKHDEIAELRSSMVDASRQLSES